MRPKSKNRTKNLRDRRCIRFASMLHHLSSSAGLDPAQQVRNRHFSPVYLSLITALDRNPTCFFEMLQRTSHNRTEVNLIELSAAFKQHCVASEKDNTQASIRFLSLPIAFSSRPQRSLCTLCSPSIGKNAPGPQTPKKHTTGHPARRSPFISGPHAPEARRQTRQGDTPTSFIPPISSQRA